MNRLKLWLPVLALFLTSCSIHGSFQGLYSYYYQTRSKAPDLLKTPEPGTSVCKIAATPEPKVIVTDGKRLRECITGMNDVVFYLWKPKCTSGFCYSLNAVQAKCDSMHEELFIVGEYYDYELMSRSYRLSRPLLGIDTKYYGSNVTSKYLPSFLSDLTGMEHVAGRFIQFRNGAFVQSCSSIDSLL